MGTSPNFARGLAEAGFKADQEDGLSQPVAEAIYIHSELLNPLNILKAAQKANAEPTSKPLHLTTH